MESTLDPGKGRESHIQMKPSQNVSHTYVCVIRSARRCLVVLKSCYRMSCDHTGSVRFPVSNMSDMVQTGCRSEQNIDMYLSSWP